MVDKIISGMSLNQVKSFFYKSISEKTDLPCFKKANVHFIDDEGENPAKLYRLKKNEPYTNPYNYQYVYVCYGVLDGCYLILVNAKKEERVWSDTTNKLKLSI